MKDNILRMSAANGEVRGFFANTKNLVNEAQKIHDLSPVASAGLGRLLTGGALMGDMLKNDTDLLTLTIKGDGPLGGIVVTANNKVNVKGYVGNPHVDIPVKSKGKLDVGGAVGNGTLTVTKDMGLKEPVSGQVNLVSGEIAEDIAYYYGMSEQIPTVVALGVLVDTDLSIKQSGGFIIQVMPNASEETISTIEKNMEGFTTVTDLLDKGMDSKEIMELVLKDLDVKFYEETPVNFYCDCNKDKIRKLLISLGKDEIIDILNEDKKAEVHCHFCNKDYLFTEDDLKEILENII